MSAPPGTPDGRYIVVKGRLWRTSNPDLPDETRQRLVNDLMNARRAIALAKGDAGIVQAERSKVQTAKVALGERGPVWWTDGAPDENRKLARNSSYADWWQRQSASAKDA